MKMKKKGILVLAVAALLSALIVCSVSQTSRYSDWFNDNIEALSDDESPKGHCKEEINLCMVQCPNPACHVHFISDPEKAGPAYNVSGVCPACHQYFHID